MACKYSGGHNDSIYLATRMENSVGIAYIFDVVNSVRVDPKATIQRLSKVVSVAVGVLNRVQPYSASDMFCVGINWALGSLVFSKSSFTCSSNLSSLNELLQQEPQHPAVVLLLQHPFAPNVSVWYNDS